MKKIVVFFTIFLVPMLCVGIFLSVSADAGRGVSIIVKDKTGKQVGLYKESHALIIGVSNYTEGWPVLQGVLDDVKSVKEILEQHGFHVVIVKDPVSDKLEAAFKDFINKYGQEPDNRLLFYFAGHGHTLKLATGLDMGYIVPADAPNPNRDKNGFLAKAVDMKSMEVYAERIQSKHAMFLFDSCFSGSLFNVTRAVPENISDKTSKPVRQFITAGSADETVPDRSIFRSQFVEALQGEGDVDKDGYVTGAELGEFLQKTVINYSKGGQHPQYGKIRNPILDKGDFVFPLKMASLGIASTPPAKPPSAEVSEEMKMLQEEKEILRREREELEQKKALMEEKNRLEEERKKLEKEKLELASLPPPPPPIQPQAKMAEKGNMVLIPAGEFMAGEPGSFKGMVLSAFYIDKYEVTQREFQQVMGNNPSDFKGCDNCPVEQVTWYEADEYCKKVGKRLPTEWEWEKAAKAGTTTTFYWGERRDMGSDYAWDFENSGKNPHPVGQKKPNGYGLYDMIGNIKEWTSSDYDSSRKVLRGGSWNPFPDILGSSGRDGKEPTVRYKNNGFRCVSASP